MTTERDCDSADRAYAVTVGLPTYNGETRLAQALDSLLAMTGPTFEIVIVDNASTDRTGDVARGYAERDDRVRYVRNAENIGAVANFQRALDLARSPFFMWASDDDVWQPNFLGELYPLLRENPDCVLATPAAIHWTQDGSYAGTMETACVATTREARLKSLLRQNASCWIYGLYRTDWLREAAPRLTQYPVFGGDVIWLAVAVMTEEVAGTNRTALYKRMRAADQYYDTDEKGFGLWHTFATTALREFRLHAPTKKLRRIAVRETAHLVYRAYVQRRNPLKALARPFQLAAHYARHRLGRASEVDLFAYRSTSSLATPSPASANSPSNPASEAM